jgi:hypothetical protein
MSVLGSAVTTYGSYAYPTADALAVDANTSDKSGAKPLSIRDDVASTIANLVISLLDFSM